MMKGWELYSKCGRNSKFFQMTPAEITEILSVNLVPDFIWAGKMLDHNLTLEEQGFTAKENMNGLVVRFKN